MEIGAKVGCISFTRIDRDSFRLALFSACHFYTIPVIIISKIIVEGVSLARRDCE